MATTTVRVDGYLALLLPWELAIEVGGRSYPTRPALVADLAAVEAALGGKLASTGAVADLCASIFAAGEGETAPDVRAWPFEVMVRVLVRYAEYAVEHAKKNSRVLAAADGEAASGTAETSAGKASGS